MFEVVREGAVEASSGDDEERDDLLLLPDSSLENCLIV